MRILVTGGAGFIGSHVVDHYIAAGHDVAVIDNFWDHGGARESNLNPKAKLYQVDIRDRAEVQRIFEAERPEVLNHHAAQHSVKLSTDNPVYDAEVNVIGLLNLMEEAIKVGTRRVIAASSGASFGTPQYLPVDEQHPQLPESPYGITKMVTEHYLRYYQLAYGIDYVAMRYGNVYGPRQDPSGEAGVIAIFSKRILNGQGVRIDWDGEQQKDYVFVGDVARANVQALTKGDNEVFCIASGRGTSVNELYQRLSQLIGREVEITRAPKRQGDIYKAFFKIDKAAQLLDWKPQVSMDEGFKQTVDFFREQS